MARLLREELVHDGILVEPFCIGAPCQWIGSMKISEQPEDLDFRLLVGLLSLEGGLQELLPNGVQAKLLLQEPSELG